MGVVDKVVVVTGAASGIGEAMVHRFVEEGAKVVGIDIDRHAGDRLVSTIESSGRVDSFEFLVADVRSEEAIEASIATARDRFGGLDVMCNNAGITGPTGPFVDIDAADWDDLFAVNCRSVFLGMKLAARMMEPGSAIINTGSTAAFTGGMTFAYSATKAAVVNMTKAAAVQLAPRGIRVNAVCPGAIVTPLLQRGRDPELLEESLTDGSMQPWRRPGLPRDVAGAALYLAGNDAGFITGHALMVDGGMMVDTRLGYPPVQPAPDVSSRTRGEVSTWS